MAPFDTRARVCRQHVVITCTAILESLCSLAAQIPRPLALVIHELACQAKELFSFEKYAETFEYLESAAC